jgi:prolyl oligopeptidase
MSDDPYLWLEDLDGEEAAVWVRARNAETLTGGDRVERLRDDLLAVLDSEDRIPYPTWHGGHLYNLWKDRAHPRGLWRRTTPEEYRKAEPAWLVLIDLDALAEREGENWIWQEATFLRPDGQRCLVALSRGGSDAAVVREFDLAERAFVADGFELPEAKNSVAWIDADRLYVGTDFGPGSLTTSGYPRLVKEWRRGTPLSDATLVYSCQPNDVIALATHDPTPGYERDLLFRWLDFFRAEVYLRTDHGLVQIPAPPDADLDTHREWLLMRLRSPWAVGERVFIEGTVLVTRFDDFVAGGQDLVPVFLPDRHTALNSYTWTRDHLILSTLADVKSRQEAVRPPGPARPLVPGSAGSANSAGSAGSANSAGSASSAGSAGEFDHTEVVATNPDHSDEYLLTSSGFTRPTTLWYGEVGGEPEVLKREPEFFDATGIEVRQHFATSADGTAVPYFVVGRRLDAPGPTLLVGYGGYEISLTPGYDGIIGRGWLADGHTYAVANIRGGGEYGPRWHRAALRENRPRAFEDFAAVASDLVARGITTRAQLGALGGSNGGLLMGVMLTRYPELFGAIASQVPLIDMKRYHRLLAGQSWMAEYGDPDDESDWEFLHAYSPYHNVHSGRAYPPALLVTSTRDDRVHPGHARKMTALLREHGYDVSYYENMEGGHGAAADNRQAALKWALILDFFRQKLVI